MIAFLKQLRLAKYSDVDLRCDFIWVVRIMPAVPTPDRPNICAEVLEELLSGHCNVLIERAEIVTLPKEGQVVQLQERLEPFFAEEVELVLNDRIKKLVRRKHVLAHGVGKVITATVEYGVDGWKVMLHITQLIFNAPKVQSQRFQYPSSNGNLFQTPDNSTMRDVIRSRLCDPSRFHDFKHLCRVEWLWNYSVHTIR
jgi:hypothetical protein